MAGNAVLRPWVWSSAKPTDLETMVLTLGAQQVRLQIRWK